MTLSTVEEALEDLRAGKFVIVVDSEARENEGDLVLAAEFVTPEAVNFMARHGRGLICVPMTAERLKELRLPLMVPDSENESPFATAFTVSVSAREGVTTGISAQDRCRTIAALANPDTRPEDLVRPGHVFPLRATEGGVLVRPGHTEAAVDLMRLAGLTPVAVICEIMKEDGSMARLPDLERFARRHGLRLIAVSDLISYRYRHETLVRRQAETHLPTEHGTFRVLAYQDMVQGDVHLALLYGPLHEGAPLVRLHSECLTGDALGSLRCDCGAQLQAAKRLIAAEGRGVILYLRQEGRGIGLLEKLRAYELQDRGLDTVEANHQLGFPADPRHYGVAGQVLRDLNLLRVRLLTNNPLKVQELTALGIEVVERVPLVTPPTEANRDYLETKRRKLGHLLPHMDEDTEA